MRRKTRFFSANSAANLRSCANLVANLRSKPKMEEDYKWHLKQDCFLCKISQGFQKLLLESNSTTGCGAIFLFFAHNSNYPVCQGSRMVMRSLRVRKVPGSSLCEVEIIMLHSWRENFAKIGIIEIQICQNLLLSAANVAQSDRALESLAQLSNYRRVE